jgi:hypothetical protein
VRCAGRDPSATVAGACQGTREPDRLERLSGLRAKRGRARAVGEDSARGILLANEQMPIEARGRGHVPTPSREPARALGERCRPIRDPREAGGIADASGI